MKLTPCLVVPFLLGAAPLGCALAAPAPKPGAAPAAAKAAETLGGGTVAGAAVGPAPAFGLGGPNMVLVKNWDFGANGTVKNMADMNANFFYRDEFGTINNGGKYGSNTVAPDLANAVGGQPIEGINSPPVREFTADSLKTYVTPLNKVTDVQVPNHNAGNGSFMAKFRLPTGGSLLGRDIVWETRVRYVTPPYFWFAIWTAGNRWKWDGQHGQGAEHDLVESFGYDNGNGNTNYDGRFFHSNTVAEPHKDAWNFWDWEGTMKTQGITDFNPTQYHIWTWVYKADNTYAMYVDGKLIQKGSDYYWTFGNTKNDEPIDMDFLFDAGWGHQQIGSVNKELPASAFEGKFFEWDYSRVYLSGGVGAPRAEHVLPTTIKAADFNAGAQNIAYGKNDDGGTWRNVTVEAPSGGSYAFNFQVSSPKGGTFHLEDETGARLTGDLAAPKSAKAVTVAAPAPLVLSSGVHAIKVVQSGGADVSSFTVTQAPGTSVAFVKTDEKTGGSWKGVYGADGHDIAGESATAPPYGTFKVNGWTVTWSGNTNEARAVQKAGGGPDDRIAGQWGTNDKSYDFDCNLTDDALHQVAFYGLDWDRNGRVARIQVLDAATKAVLDERDLDAYGQGKYLVWNIRGPVIFHVINTSGWTNPALSAVFFDPPTKTKGA